jgi:hypothetical protein
MVGESGKDWIKHLGAAVEAKLGAGFGGAYQMSGFFDG